MKKWLWILGVVGLGMLLSAVFGRAGSATNPGTVNLRLTDMPAGFTLKSDVWRDNAQAAKADQIPAAQENAKGRVLSSDRDFRRSGLIGILDIESTVIAYKDAASAHADYLRKAAAKLPAIFAHTSAGNLGVERFGYYGTQKSDGVALAADFSAFRRGQYIVVVSTGGLAASLPGGSSALFATTVDQRIQHGG